MHNHYIENLFELKGFNVNSFVQENDRIVLKVSSTNSSGKCPYCGSISSKIHDYRRQDVKHAILDEKVVILSIRKKRFTCPHCHHHFTEDLGIVGRYQRMTSSFVQLIWKKLSEVRAVSAIAEECHLSSPTAVRVFNKLRLARKQLPSVLCIDEFKGNANGEKFLCALIDGETSEVIDILPSRKMEDLEAYFKAIPLEERNQVRFFVSDMYANYRTLAENHFPNAIIIADKFHFARQCSWAFENIRKNAQKTMDPTLRKYYKRSKSIMRKKRENLTPEEQEKLIVMLNYNDDLKEAYRLKELFREFLSAKDRASAADALDDWLKEAEKSGLIEFEDCIKAMRNWREEILNYYCTGFSNGRIEGTNNKIKVIKRISYGYRNFNNFRQRILFCCRQRKSAKRKMG